MNLRRFVFPILWELLFVIACVLWDQDTLKIYFIFYLGLIVYYREYFSFHRLFHFFRKIKKFWIPVILTAAALWGANRLSNYLPVLFSRRLNDGVIGVWTSGLSDTLLLAVTMVVLMPVAEGLFFRKAIIVRGEGVWTALSVLCSFAACIFAHANGPMGALETVVLALPLTLAYLITGNRYVPMLAHFIFKIYDVIPYVVYIIARVMLS